MGLESVSSQLSLQSTAPNRADAAANTQFKESIALRERQDATKAQGTSAARSQKAETRDYQNSGRLLANSQQSRDDSLTDTRGGGKRGGVLDISV